MRHSVAAGVDTRQRAIADIKSPRGPSGKRTSGRGEIAGFSVIDSILNASMILTGMGPVGELPTTDAKLFASMYALFSGLVFVIFTGILLTPIVHRLLHKFHFEESRTTS